MKTQVLFGVLVAILLVGVRSEDEDVWSAEEQNCVDELKLNKADIQTINKQDIVPEDHSDFNNFLSCYWKKKGSMNEDGDIDFDVVYHEFLTEFRKLFGKAPDVSGVIIGGMIKTAITDCKKAEIEGSTHGETVAKLQNCVIKHLMKAIEEMSAERK